MRSTKNYLEVGSVPHGEECAQVGADNYRERAIMESNAFIGQLRRKFGMEPEGAVLAIKAFNHDMGTYHEVVVWYDENKPGSVAYAFKIENDVPEYWDKEAKSMLDMVAV